MFCFFEQDINLKVAKNNQALHFQFREDKQWKLQQVQFSQSHVTPWEQREETVVFVSSCEDCMNCLTPQVKTKSISYQG